jgi:hypothetical protein
MRDDSTDTFRITVIRLASTATTKILLPRGTRFLNQLLQQPNFVLNSIMFGDDAL